MGTYLAGPDLAAVSVGASLLEEDPLYFYPGI
jgi:hypothetical protein